MTCSDRLTSCFPIVQVQIAVHQRRNYWVMAITHRHASGVLGDCGTTEYADLTLGELADVLECEIDSWGYTQGVLPFDAEI